MFKIIRPPQNRNNVCFGTKQTLLRQIQDLPPNYRTNGNASLTVLTGNLQTRFWHT